MPYLSASSADHRSAHGLFAVGKTIYVGLVGSVTLEVMLISRYMTALFLVVVAVSYLLVYPYFWLYPAI